jgi:hypothetical protein
MSSTLEGEGGIIGALEGVEAVPLEAARLPDALDRVQREADRLSNSAAGPVRGLTPARRATARTGKGFAGRAAARPSLPRHSPAATARPRLASWRPWRSPPAAARWSR